jgi:hypothetical protein
MVKVKMGKFKEQPEEKPTEIQKIIPPQEPESIPESRSTESPSRSTKTSRNPTEGLEKRIAALEMILNATQPGIDPIIVKTWDSVYANFLKRHAKLKQGPLQSQYERLNTFFHPP